MKKIMVGLCLVTALVGVASDYDEGYMKEPNSPNVIFSTNTPENRVKPSISDDGSTLTVYETKSNAKQIPIIMPKTESNSSNVDNIEIVIPSYEGCSLSTECSK